MDVGGGDDDGTATELARGALPALVHARAPGGGPSRRSLPPERGGARAAVAGSGEAVPLTATLAATTLGVRVGRHVGDDLTWLVVEALEAPRPRLVLTTESAGALHRALGAQLELAAGR